jgi:protein involved in plasmid replication-relaxation
MTTVTAVSINNSPNETRRRSMQRARPGAAVTKARLTDRDRQLTGLLAVARYLSTEQLSKLLYAARNIDNMRRRFLCLAGEGPRGFKPAYIRRLFYRTYEGHHLDMWTLTNAGYTVAEIVLGTAVKIPRHDVGAAFREHTIVLNELFVALMLPTGGNYARAKQDDFRWIPSDTVRLPWRQNLGPGSRTPDRLVLPDAVLEIPSSRRRFFLECEMGTHPILSGKHPKPGSTIAKVQSYEGFLRSYVDASATETFYARFYPDKYLLEVLFLVRTPHRAKAINEAIRQWRERLGTQTCPARALTIDAARDELAKMLGGRSNRGQGPPAAEQRRGLSLEEIATVRRFYNGTVLAFKEMRAKARSQSEAPPSYPPMVEEMQALVERLSAAS